MVKKISSSILAKAILIIVVITVVFIASLFVISAFYIEGTLKHIDSASLSEKSKRLKEIFDSELKIQNSLVKNWGVWDDLYEYSSKPNEKFEKANLSDENINDLVSHFILIFNKDSKLVSYAQKDKNTPNLANELIIKSICLSKSNQLKVSQKITDSICVENIFGQDIVYAMHPIVRSDKNGDTNGVVVFARWIDNSFYDNVSRLFGSVVTKVDLTKLPPELAKKLKLSKDNDLGWIDIDNEKKEAYLYFDNSAKPFALKYEFSRDFYSYGLDMLKKFGLIGLAVILSGSFFMFWFLKNQILSRLIEMSNLINKIGNENDEVYLKVYTQHSDEIEQMSKSINLMLKRLYAYQSDLARRGEELQEEVAKKIEELRKKDAALIRQSRYVTIGETISNISHQWKQPLNDLWLILQSISSKYKTGKLDQEKYFELMGEAKKLISFMSETIDDFQTFSRPDKERVAFFVNDMIQRAIGIASSSMANNHIEITLREDGRFIGYGVPNEFAQAVLNIINNARDAFADKDIDKKSINISIESIAGMIVVGIDDNAGGIPEDSLDKIFEPYYSTKYSKGGSGIGLYITKQAIEQCDGGGVSASNSSHGAVFTIVLKEIEN